MESESIPANIKFLNNYIDSISISWFNETKNEETHYCLLPPGRHYIQPTYISQQWVIKNGTTNKRLGSFSVESANIVHEISLSGDYITKEMVEGIPVTMSTAFNGYERLDSSGFIVYFEPGVFEYEPRLKKHLFDDLAECRKIISLSKMAQELMNTPCVYVNKDYKYDNKSADRACCSHWSANWLKLNDNLPEKEGSVEIYDAKRYVDWCIDQPAMFFHELSHSYHFYIRNSSKNAMREKDLLITETYEKAKQSGKYESVMRIYGRMVKHYGLTNSMEFFAECSEAFFSTSRFRNDFYPFVFEEFKEFDIEAFNMVAIVWDVEELLKESGKIFDVTTPPDYCPVLKKYIGIRKRHN